MSLTSEAVLLGFYDVNAVFISTVGRYFAWEDSSQARRELMTNVRWGVDEAVVVELVVVELMRSTSGDEGQGGCDRVIARHFSLLSEEP